MDNPASVVTDAVKQGSKLGFVLKVIVAIFLTFLVLDIIAIWVPDVKSYLLSPFTTLKAKWAAYKAKSAPAA